MAVLVGCRTLLQAFRVHTAERDLACRLGTTSICSRHYISSGQIRPARHGAVTRHYSSDSKDDLRVKYLDGEDAGKFRSVSSPIEMFNVFVVFRFKLEQSKLKSKKYA